MSLRARLVAVASALVVVGLVVAAFVSYTALRSSLLKRVDQQLVTLDRRVQNQVLRGDVNSIGRFAGFDTVAGSPPFFQVRDADGTVLGSVVFRPPGERTYTPQLPQHLPAVPVDTDPSPGGPSKAFTVSAAESGGPAFRVSVSSLGVTGQTLIVALPLRDVSNTLGRFRNIELLVTVAVALAVAGLGWWLVRVSMRPLEGMVATADAIAAGDLSRRVSPADDETEVGRLGLALNTMLEGIENAFDEQQRSEDRLRRFVADASHELRTPLTSIRGYAELFRRGAATRPDDLAKAMARIEGEAERMGVLVEEMLLLARLDQGRPLDRQPVDLSAMAAEVVADARVVEPTRSIELDVLEPVQVVGDGARLRQVFDNLITNIRTHTPPGTPATVQVRGDGSNAVVVVEDRGPGMTEDQAARAFERFYRVDPSRARTSGGAGLGLSIVSAIVAAHHGSVALDSTPGQGARFTITLPVDGPPPALAVEDRSVSEDDEELDQPVVLGADRAEAGVGDAPVGEGDGDRAADPDGVA
ncbi:MAG: HAMP domain-containing histidine kinase [Acidimicrobiia bacterium]|nr:HAMP domain-containing histidine kinase [Acidimicrobiia bacterium]